MPDLISSKCVCSRATLWETSLPAEPRSPETYGNRLSGLAPSGSASLSKSEGCQDSGCHFPCRRGNSEEKHCLTHSFSLSSSFSFPLFEPADHHHHVDLYLRLCFTTSHERIAPPLTCPSNFFMQILTYRRRKCLVETANLE